MIEYNRPDGKTCPAYNAQAEGPGLVVIQEWWGLNDQIKSMADKFAEAGFNSIVPDLYRGKLASDADEANHMMTNLDWGGAVEDVQGGLDHLQLAAGRTGVLGFCMGGALTIIAATKLKYVDAAVCFYGIPPAEVADPSTIKSPFLAHFATQDDWCTPEAVDALEAKLKSGGVDYELHRYEGTQHAFMNQARPEVYNKDAAQLAWDRSVEFLKAKLT